MRTFFLFAFALVLPLALPVVGLAQLTATSSTPDPAVYGESTLQGSPSTYGTLGDVAFGVFGESSDGAGVGGRYANGNYGWLGSSMHGVYGEHNNGNYGFLGGVDSGVNGSHTNGNLGYVGDRDYGVYGQHNLGSFGFLGGTLFGSGARGVYGQYINGNQGYLGSENAGLFAGGDPWAGYFSGDVNVTGTLTKGGGAFKIDHPLDPAGQYLSHSFVESPDMMNVYNGNTTTDASGEAVVILPDYFEALNREFRYQLTVIGQFAQAIVAEKIRSNRFVIRTDQPNVEVSWQVTGIRQDRWAEENRIVVEEAKPGVEQGFYLYPALYDQPEERGVTWARDPEGMRAIQEMPQRMAEERQRMEAHRERIEAQRPRPGENR